ncbi:MAG: chromate transporter [Mycobacterium leprae]
MAILLKVFGLMFGIGALTFGGGYAIVGVLQNYIVTKLHWLTMAEFNTGIVVGQVTPGPLSTMVAYLGYKLSGIPGSVVATVGLLLPSFICSLLIAKAYQKVKTASWVPAVTKGLSLAIVALLVGALVTLIPSSIVDPWTILIGVATFFITGPWKKDPVWPFIGAAVVGIFLYR